MQFPLVYTGNRVTIEKLSDRLYFRQGDLNARRQCNGGYLVTDEGVVAVDAPSEEASEEMVQECQQLFGKPICALVLTHPHPDHVWGLDALLAKTGQIPVFAGKGAGEEIKNQGMQMPVNLIEIEGRENIPIGRAMMHLEKVPVQAHSPWDLMLFLQHEQALFTGDLVVPANEMYFKDCLLSGWEETLTALQHRLDVTLLRGHGEAAEPAQIKEQKAFLKAMHAVYAAMKKSGLVEQPYTEETVRPVFDEKIEQGDENAKTIWRVANKKVYYQLFKLFVTGREA